MLGESMTITISTWIISAIITVVAIYIAYFKAPESSGNDFGVSAVFGLAYMLAAIAVSLQAWLIYTLAT